MSQLTIDQAMQIALGHHQAGRWAEAEAIYRQVLAQCPDHVGAMHLLGVLACQTGQTDAAIDLIRRAIAINPTAAECHHNLIVVAVRPTADRGNGNRRLPASAARSNCDPTTRRLTIAWA